MAKLLTGAPVAAAIKKDLTTRIAKLLEKSVTPAFATLRVGERPDDRAYENQLIKQAASLGMNVSQKILSAGATQDELMAAINSINSDSSLHGCLLFRPLPPAFNEKKLSQALSVTKDIDGISPLSQYAVFANARQGFAPCTAEAVMRLLDYYGFELSGKRVVVIGRSLVVGRPVAMMLLARDATVTLCHSKTQDLAKSSKNADIIIVATGHQNTLTAAHVSSQQIIVDVGMNWDEQSSSLVGDVSFDEVEPVVAAITPVPKGVGTLTSAILLEHVVKAAEKAYVYEK